MRTKSKLVKQAEKGAVEFLVIGAIALIGFILAGGMATFSNSNYGIVGQLAGKALKLPAEKTLQLQSIAFITFTPTPNPSGTSTPTGSPAPSTAPTTAPTVTGTLAKGALHIQGKDIVDSNGNVVYLRGAMMETPFAYINSWQKGTDPTTTLNSKTFNEMQAWKMNAFRLNMSQWIYNLNPANFMSKLDTVVNSANQAGLYVVLDFHDDKQSGAAGQYADDMLHKTSLTWWQTIATHFIHNPMVLFDVINEPAYPDWNTLAHGNGGDIVGELDVCAAIRTTGAQQICVIEPGGAAAGAFGGWAGFPISAIGNLTNILPSKHTYHHIALDTDAQKDAYWGPFLNAYPLYYGEWGILPVQDQQCSGMIAGVSWNTNSAVADSLTNGFLDYMGQRGASWTAYQFTPNYLIQNTTSYQPTDFSGTWYCGSAAAHTKGMGADVKTWLQTH